MNGDGNSYNLNGRQLDAAVAIALGWRYTNSAALRCYDCVLVSPDDAAKLDPQFLSVEPGKRVLYRQEMPAFSTDGNAMLLVLAWLRERGWWLRIETHAHGPCAEVRAETS